MKPPLPSASCAALTCAPRSVSSASSRLLITNSFLTSVKYLYSSLCAKRTCTTFRARCFLALFGGPRCLFQLLFQHFELFRLRVFFVKRIERITARHQAVPRPGGAIAERAAQPLRLQAGAVDHVVRQVVIGKNHSSQPDKIYLTGADVILSDVRQPILQVCVARS